MSPQILRKWHRIAAATWADRALKAFGAALAHNIFVGPLSTPFRFFYPADYRARLLTEQEQLDAQVLRLLDGDLPK